MRRHGWFVGEVDFDRGTWRFDANRGNRELALEFGPDGPDTRVTVYLSAPVPQPTRPPGVRPAPRPSNDRPPREGPPRGDDDDNDDDDGDDDD
jgi:hypothetical protein